ncbi:subtilase [Plectosphaerella plurivora]|uniref:Subtilase n=1 Tax=Plectosphaerella plurivora TaxID=936078 RepID=A0A9P8VAY5_9PEZI|nr:subtilase [Plectosphaerella plurivora]
MRLLPLSIAALAMLPGLLAQDVPEAGDSTPLPLNGYIVEFAPGSHVKTKRDELLSQDVRVVKTFDSAVFAGALVETDDLDIDALPSLPGVVRAWPNERVELLAPIAKRQVQVGGGEADQHAVHWATGVEELHERGILGEGVKIGVVDTGIWYTHSALGGAFGPGHKVVGGYDLVGDNWVSGTAKNPDADPKDEQGHGTHVAGIIAGDSSTTGWKGVAPAASLYAYKIFGPGDGTDQATVIEAFLRAYDDGMDIITASVGGRGGFANNAWAVVADRIADEGVVVTIGAGNSGNGGAYYASTGSSGALTLSVASVEVKRNTTTLPSWFTSWGGLYDGAVKPDISAPGTDVFSTWLGEDDEQYVLLSGTSMATPYVAGVAALYISANGGREKHGKTLGRDLAMRIVSSGVSVPWLIYGGGADGAFRAPSHQVGTGLVDAKKVVDGTVSAELVRFGLNDTANFRKYQDVVLRNEGSEKVYFSFEVEKGAGFDMLRSFDARDVGETPRMKYRFEIEPREIGVEVKVPQSFDIGPGQTRKARFVFEAPQGLNETALPAYSGRVVIKGSNGDVLAVPYQGLGFDLRKEMGSFFHGTYPWLRGKFPPVPSTTFSLDLSRDVQDYPKIFSKLKWGTRELRWDIYDDNYVELRHWRYPPIVGDKGYLGSATSWVGSGSATFNPERHDVNDTVSFPLRDQGRNALVAGGYTSAYYWFGRLADGRKLEPGNYTMRYAALVPFANPERSESWKGVTTKFTLL